MSKRDTKEFIDNCMTVIIFIFGIGAFFLMTSTIGYAILWCVVEALKAIMSVLPF